MMPPVLTFHLSDSPGKSCPSSYSENWYWSDGTYRSPPDLYEDLPIFGIRRRATFPGTIREVESQYGWHHQHTDFLRRVVCGLRRVAGDTAALIVIPKFLGLAV